MEKIYLIGIGGGSAAYLVDLLRNEGKEVSGSDAKHNSITDRVSLMGVDVHIPHDANFITEDISEVWYSAAITESSLGYIELLKAKELRIPIFTFAEAAARYFNRAKVRIAVAGTHGKSTTTAMLGWVLEKAGLNPTVALGAKLNAWGGNSRVGNPGLFVIEADEYARRFLEYHPTHTIVLNVDHDHFDTYSTEDEFVGAFRALVGQTSELVVINKGANNSLKVIDGCKAEVADFGSEQDVKLLIPGEHNRSNAKAVIQVATRLGVSLDAVIDALGSFSGISRRFEHIGSLSNDVEIYDDFGHHPTEIAATLAGAREMYPGYKIILVHQPHQAGRLAHLMNETANALSGADEIILLPVFTVAGRENNEDVKNATSNILAQKLVSLGKGVEVVLDNDQALKKVQDLMKQKSLVITMGATDVWKVGRGLLKK